MRLGLILTSIFLAACNGPHIPTLPGPADKVHCTISREGSMIGRYECTVSGQYQLKEVDLLEAPGL